MALTSERSLDRQVFKVTLVQMPFAPLRQASLALLQLQAALQQSLGDRVSTRIVYVSHDFGTAMGINLYHRIAHADASVRIGDMCGLGDWFFRQVAFPTLPDNTAAYQERFFAAPESAAFIDLDGVAARRTQARALLQAAIDKYELQSADLVGFTSMFVQHAACIAMARLLKSGAHPPRVVIGGANCEGAMGQALADNVPWFDAVFSGPGLKSFPAYVRSCIEGRPSGTAIRGVLTNRNGNPDGTEKRPRPNRATAVALLTIPIRKTAVSHDNLGEEVDINVPLRVDYEGFLDAFEQAFNGTLHPVLPFETSRGCWWGAKAHCPFCGLNGSTIAFRSLAPSQAIDMFEHLFRHADRCPMFESVDNIMPADYPVTVFPHLRPPPGTSIYYEVKADLTASDLAAMARAGVGLIQPGIEALATSSLKALKKGTTALGNVLLLKNCLAYGVWPVWNFLIGIPREENPSHVYAKYACEIPKLRHLQPPWAVFKVRIDRFSPYFMDPDSYGLALRPKAFYSFVYPFSEDALFDLAYHFDDGNAETALYAQAAAEWQPVLDALVREWRQLWRVADATRRPALFAEPHEGAYRLHDSRTGTVTECTIDEHTFDALTHLSRPLRESNLLERLALGGCPDAAGVLAELRDRQLLFEENDRLLSLVHIGPRPVLPPVPAGI